MSLSLESYRVKPTPAGEDQTSNRSPEPNYQMMRWSMIVAATKALFSRFSQNSRPAISLSARTTSAIEEPSRPFTAKESFKRGADLVFFGDELYKWRREFNIPPAFIALRNIESGEQVFNDPTNLERSDLMIHWALTYYPEEK